MITIVVISVLSTLVVVLGFIIILQKRTAPRVENKSPITGTVQSIQQTQNKPVAIQKASVPAENEKYKEKCIVNLRDSFTLFAALQKRSSVGNNPINEWLNKYNERNIEINNAGPDNETVLYSNLYQDDPFVLLPTIERYYSDLATQIIEAINGCINDFEKAYPELKGHFAQNRLGDAESARLGQILRSKGTPVHTALGMIQQQQRICLNHLNAQTAQSHKDEGSELLDLGVTALAFFVSPLMGAAKVASAISQGSKEDAMNNHRHGIYVQEHAKLNKLCDDLFDHNSKVLDDIYALILSSYENAFRTLSEVIEKMSKSSIELKVLFEKFSTNEEKIDKEILDVMMVIVEEDIKNNPKVAPEVYKRIKQMVKEAA